MTWFYTITNFCYFCYSSIEQVPKSAAAITALMGMQSRALIPSEPLDCTTPPALNLCTRRERSRSPNPEGANHGSVNISPDTNMHLDSTKTDYARTFYFRPESDSDEKSSVNSDIINHNDFSSFPIAPSLTVRSKTARPFKAYPKDPFFLALGASTADALLGQESTEAYAEFRKKMLIQVQANNPPPGVTNTKMRRSSNNSQHEGKDQSYWEKRRKNNEAAKRSRDARRAKEDEIAIRAAFLEQENLKLKYEIAALRNEIAKQRCIMYN